MDFVLAKNGKIIGIEVKSGGRTTNKGLQVFREKFSPKNAFVVGGEAFGIEEFLKLDLEKLWW